MRRIWILALLLPALLLPCTPLSAEEGARLPQDVEQAVGLIAQAHAAGDDEKLAVYAAQPSPPDPWLVADALCARKAYDAADAYAARRTLPDAKALSALVQAERDTPTPKKARAAYEVSREHAQRGRLQMAKATVEAAGPMGAVTLVLMEYLHADILRAGRDYAGAMKMLQRSAQRAAALGWHQRAADTYAKVGLMAGRLGSHALNVQCCRLCLESRRLMGHPGKITAATINLGFALLAAGKLEEASVRFDEGQQQAQALRIPRLIGSAMRGRSNLARAGGDLAAARGHLERAWELEQQFGTPRSKALLDALLGLLLYEVHDLDRAHRHFDAALTVWVAQNDLASQASIHLNKSRAWSKAGRRREAVEAAERGLELARKARHPVREVNALARLADTHRAAGDPDRALPYAELAVARYRTAGNAVALANSLRALGLVQRDRGASQEAEASLRESLALAAGHGQPLAEAGLELDLGIVLSAAGRHEEAVAACQAALAVYDKAGQLAGSAHALVNRGAALMALQRGTEALADFDRAIELAQRAGMPLPAVQALRNRARLLTTTGDHAGALAAVRQALALVPDIAGGLGEGAGTTAADDLREVLHIGSAAAHALGETAEALTLAERAHATALLDAFGGRDAVEHAALPETEREARARARAEVLAIRQATITALARGDRRAALVRKEGLDKAVAQLGQIDRRVARGAGLAMDLVRPRPLGLKATQDLLRAEEALLLFFLSERYGQVFILTETEVQSVYIADPKPLRSAIARLDAGDPERDPEAAVARLRTLLGEHLEIPAGVRRLLIGPSGPLSSVPFALFFPQHEIAYVPSAATYGLLRARAQPGGREVLALGGPIYAGVRRFPAARDSAAEARAVGDVDLLGAQAAKRPLRKTLARPAPWRAVHLACPAVVDEARPLDSFLALSTTAGGDDELTAREVLGLQVNADLVVLSACETARGRAYSGNGEVALSRSFLIAGTPRVLCSLWRVDDDATRVLMTEFYKLWGGADGKPGRGAAAALVQAQSHVRNHPEHPEWKHPHYWAAWTLWGLAD